MNVQAIALAKEPAAGHHHVRFYDDESLLIEAVADYVASGIRAGRPVVAIVTPIHRELLMRRLDTLGLAPATLLGTVRLTLLDATETLARLLRDGMPDPEAFDAVIGALIADRLSVEPAASVCAYGEMVDLLSQSGNHAAAIALEGLWNQLLARRSITLLCSYDLRAFPHASDREAFEHVCGQHDVIFPVEDGSHRRSESTGTLARIASLEQQARALTSEITYRRRLEEGLRQALEQRQKAEAEVRTREEELRDFFQTAAEPMHAVGADGRIEWVNDAELELLGYTAEEYVGHHFAEFHVDTVAAGQVLERLIANETLRNHEAQLRHKDGSVRDVLITSNVFWRHGSFIHTRCFTRDITARKQTARALSEAVRARDDFIAIAAHELRNPLHAVHLLLLGAIERNGAGDKGAPSDTGALLRRASLQVTRLGRLIDNLLDVSRIAAGRLQIENEPCELVELLRELVDRHRGDALSLAFESDGPEIRGSWDPLRVDQVVTNLLVNAIRYGKGLPVRVSVRATTEQVTIQVADQGDGISERDRERIFERFERAVSDHTPGGMGLGLWITRQIVDAMGGRITVVSTVGDESGSLFEVTLPRYSA